MSILDTAELLLQAKNYVGSGDWLDESGNGHDAQLGSTPGADTNDPTYREDPPAFLFATDDHMEIPDHDDLDFGASDSFTIMVAAKLDAAISNYDQIVEKRSSSTLGYHLLAGSPTTTAMFAIGDGAIVCSDMFPLGLSTTETAVVAGRRDVAADDVTVFSDGVASGSPATDTTTATLATSTDLVIGRKGYGPSLFFDGEIVAVALWRSALTDQEIDDAATMLVLAPDDMVSLSKKAVQIV